MEHGTNYHYMSVAVSRDIKSEIRRLAKKHRRSMSQQAGELLELGLAEYNRENGAAEQSVDREAK
jgi:hypothetical protein